LMLLELMLGGTGDVSLHLDGNSAVCCVACAVRPRVC